MRSILEVTDRDGITQYVPYAAITHFEAYRNTPVPLDPLFGKPVLSVLHLVGGERLFVLTDCADIEASFGLDRR